MRRHSTVTEHTLKDILDAFNRHDTDGVLSFFADDCALDMPRGAAPWGTRLIGKAQVRDGTLAVLPVCLMCTMETITTPSVAIEACSSGG